MAEFFALWKLRMALPDLIRQKVPGGWFGLVLVTLAPLIVVVTALYRRIADSDSESIMWALGAMALGMVLYIPIRLFVKPGVPDVDPFVMDAEEA